MRKSTRRKEMGEVAWAAYQKERASQKSNVWKSRNAEKVVNWRRRAKIKLIEYKGGKCEVCGLIDACPGVYDFHHLDPKEKEFGIGGKCKRWELLTKEVDKCILVCRNCHAKIHDKEFIKGRQKTIEKQQQREQKRKTCEACNKPFIAWKVSQKYCCTECIKRDYKGPSGEVLKSLLWQKPTRQIAKDYNVSDKAVEKWAKKFGLSKPPRGYWKNRIRN